MPQSLDLERLRRFETDNQRPSSAAVPERGGVASSEMAFSGASQ